MDKEPKNNEENSQVKENENINHETNNSPEKCEYDEWFSESPTI